MDVLERGVDFELFKERLGKELPEDALLAKELLGVWQLTLLSGLLKLQKNQIRYNALKNFVAKKVPSIPMDHCFEVSLGDEPLKQLGEGLVGVLFPDKKSAIATAISNQLKCKNSLVIKGLFLMAGHLALGLKQQEETLFHHLKDFVQYFNPYKSELASYTRTDLFRMVVDLMLLQEVLKLDASLEEDLLPVSPGLSFNKKLGIGLAAFLVFAVLGFWWLSQRSTEQDSSLVENEEIIPLDSLRKFNDSLAKASIDSAYLKSDSTLQLQWPKGKAFDLPKTSALVELHAYLSDTTQTEPLELPIYEFQFDTETQQIIGNPPYFFRRLVEGLQAYRQTKVQLFTFSENLEEQATKRGFVLKNRLVGEGLSPKRIEVKGSGTKPLPDASKPANAQSVLLIEKR